MRGAQNGESERDRIVQRAPLLDRVVSQAVPVQPVFHRFRRQALAPQALRCGGQPCPSPAQQEFPCQPAGHVKQHCPNGEPGQHRVEVDAGMNHNQQ